jgi:hypothetical protein
MLNNFRYYSRKGINQKLLYEVEPYFFSKEWSVKNTVLKLDFTNLVIELEVVLPGQAENNLLLYPFGDFLCPLSFNEGKKVEFQITDLFTKKLHKAIGTLRNKDNVLVIEFEKAELFKSAPLLFKFMGKLE